MYGPTAHLHPCSFGDGCWCQMGLKPRPADMPPNPPVDKTPPPAPPPAAPDLFSGVATDGGD